MKWNNLLAYNGTSDSLGSDLKNRYSSRPQLLAHYFLMNESSKHVDDDSVTRVGMLSDKCNELELTAFEYLLTIKLFSEVFILKSP